MIDGNAPGRVYVVFGGILVQEKKTRGRMGWKWNKIITEEIKTTTCGVVGPAYIALQSCNHHSAVFKWATVFVQIDDPWLFM